MDTENVLEFSKFHYKNRISVVSFSKCARFINTELIKLITGCIWILKLVEFSKVTNMILFIFLFIGFYGSYYHTGFDA